MQIKLLYSIILVLLLLKYSGRLLHKLLVCCFENVASNYLEEIEVILQHMFALNHLNRIDSGITLKSVWTLETYITNILKVSMHNILFCCLILLDLYAFPTIIGLNFHAFMFSILFCIPFPMNWWKQTNSISIIRSRFFRNGLTSWILPQGRSKFGISKIFSKCISLERNLRENTLSYDVPNINHEWFNGLIISKIICLHLPMLQSIN